MIPKGPHGIGELIHLFVRGLLLWIVVPVGFVAWVGSSRWQIKRKVALGQFLDWIDSNMLIIIERSVLRPFFPTPTHSWVPTKDRAQVQHRIGVSDFF
jgi:hypothetical protein